MAPPRRYSDRQIISALHSSPSVIAASRLIGMSNGALRKRIAASESIALVLAFEQCNTRGKASRGKPHGDYTDGGST